MLAHPLGLAYRRIRRGRIVFWLVLFVFFVFYYVAVHFACG